MKTILYMVPHGVTDGPSIPRQAGCCNPPLSPLGVRQAELTRDLLGIRAIDVCFCGPQEQAVETALIVAEPHGLMPIRMAALGDLAEGETIREFHKRVATVIDGLMNDNEGDSLLVVAHCRVNGTYLAGLLGLRPSRANVLSLDDCGISIVVRDGMRTSLNTLNASFHLQGVAA
jgi:broad specificity phosphatase PhoE